MKVKVTTEQADQVIEIDTYPDTCPKCLRGIDPRFKFGYVFNNVRSDIVYQCPRQDCRELFIAYYFAHVNTQGQASPLHRLKRLAPQTHQNRIFSEHIISTSGDFVRIFNQANHAEELGMSDIAGPGYRKALEFLIKDYSILSNSEASEAIKHKQLSSVINDYVTDTNVKSTAKRAAWLGNDETHYYRKWEDKDIRDLKILIELTVRCIESEELTRKYEEEMP